MTNPIRIVTIVKDWHYLQRFQRCHKYYSEDVKQHQTANEHMGD